MEASVKIHNDDGISRGLPQSAQAVQGGKVDAQAKAGQAKAAGEDRVELSDRARAMQVASTALDKSPEIRQDKVDQFKALLKDGKYNVPGEKIADRLLGEGLFA
jgi:negative regulator of flagellin synthesis FlgM